MKNTRKAGIGVLMLTLLFTILPACDPRTDPLPVSEANVWLTEAEIMRLPTTGLPYQATLAAANSNWGNADLGDLDSEHDVKTLAGALIAVRNNDSAMRSKTRAAIMSVLSSPLCRVLEASRGIQAYVIAADIVGLTGQDETDFRNWLTSMRTFSGPRTSTSPTCTHGSWTGHSSSSNMRDTALRSVTNWGCHARASMVATDLYLGLPLDQWRNTMRAWLTPTVHNNAWFPHDLRFGSTGGTGPDSWYPQQTNPNIAVVYAGINPRDSAGVDGRSVEYLLPEEMRRSGTYTDYLGQPFPGQNYVYEALQGCLAAATMLYRQNVAGIDRGLIEEMSVGPAISQMAVGIGWPIQGDDHMLGALYEGFWNAPTPAYHTPTTENDPNWAGKGIGYTAWTHLGQCFDPCESDQ